MMKLKTAIAVLILVWGLLYARAGYAIDPPHVIPDQWTSCWSCHMVHNAPGAAITKVKGNPNLCMSCHTPGGLATARPFADSDQALPGQSGTSHRFDSGPSGHVEASLANTSTGEVSSGGAFTGRIERTYTITITTAGDVGTATFGWVDSEGNNGSGTADVDVPLNDGLTLTFTDGTTPSFVLSDTWTLYVRTDLRLPDAGDPFEYSLYIKIKDGGKAVCSTCHDQHSQEMTPADPAAPPYGGFGTGSGRHFQRVDNDLNQMCHVCHDARNVTSSSLGSHPVGVSIPGVGPFQSPVSLNLVGGNVDCTTCHNPHYTDSGGANGGAGDGYLLNLYLGNLCYDCHTIGDQATASHLSAASGVLWPGGEYGSSFPAHSAEKRGFCVNCHWPHGWPDDGAPASDFSKLWVERYDTASDGSDPDDAEDLCFTCHDGSPAGTDINAEFLKGTNGVDIFHHPVKDSEQTAGRSVECIDCHNPHEATSADRHKGVDGIDLNGDPIGPGTANPVDIVEHEVCFKCHGDTYNASRPDTTNKRLDFQTTNSAFHPVAGSGRNQSSNLNDQLLGGLTTSSTLKCSDCHNSEATADAAGPASNSTQSPKGTHGSANEFMLRGNYWTDLLGPSNWNASNFEFCFLCHDSNKLVEAREWDDDAATNFYDDIDGKDNLHWEHLENNPDDTRATCRNCHFNIHSNRTAGNTQYRIDGVLTDTPPDGVHTHLVNFSPDIEPFGGRAKPEWWFNTSSRERRCYLSCHGEGEMEGDAYRPDQGDDNPTVP